jgi:putative nucleotidyltransferase with HDIG domain
MADLPRAARLTIYTLIALAAGMALFSAVVIQGDVTLWLAVAVIAVAIALLDAFPIFLALQIETTVSDIVKFAAVLLCPAPVVTLGTFIGTFFAEARVKRAWFKMSFNIAEMTIAWTMGAWFYDFFHQPGVDYFGSAQNVLAPILAGLVAFAVNSLLLTLVLSFASRMPFRFVLFQNIPQVFWQDLSILSLGIFLAVLWRYNPLTTVLAAIPLVMVRQSFEMANQLQRQTREALIALVQVIDERDEFTFDHSKQVSARAESIAIALNLPPREVEIIASAALLHDLGKVGMADAILFSTRRLSQPERKSAERHAEIGAILLDKFPLFQKGAHLVRHHHERFDGTGYPDGLKGEEIPLGSRIIAVADAYQAMIEERSYRRALSKEAAVKQLLDCNGTQFDPAVVQTFLQVLNFEPEAVTPLKVPLVAPVGSE